MSNVSRFPTRLVRATTLAVSVSALLSAGSAMAVEHLYGGGSTFAATPYVGNDYLNTTPSARLSTNAGNTAGSGFNTADITVGSMFDAFSAHFSLAKVSYCQTGSGFGKNSLNGVSTALASGQCNDFSVSPSGLSAPTDSPDFAGTDAPYSTNDYNAFLNGTQFTPHQGILQIPTIAGAIALPHNDTVSNVALHTINICRIYSGQNATWKSVAGVTGTAATGPIKIIYRTDGSGTTFAFTRYLAATCNGTTMVPSGFTFTPNQSFNAALPNGVTGTYGTRSLGASGNAGVVQATLDPANPGALGYADIGEVIAEGAGYATVNGFDPAKFGLNSSNVHIPLTIAVTSLLTGKVLDGATVNDAPGVSSQTIKNCVRLVDPTLKLSSTYPIAAITYLAGYYSGNGTTAHVSAIKNLFDLAYNHTVRPVLPTGFAYLDGSITFASSVKASVNACVTP